MALFSKKHTQDTPRRRLQPTETERSTSRDLEQRYTFRRNRTITGSASSGVVGANEDKGQLKSARVQAHELARKRRHIGGVLVIVLISCGALYGLLWQFTAEVTVESRVASISLDDSYEEAVQSYFAAQPIERLRFLLDDNHLNEYMRQKTPEIASIELDGSAGFGKSAFTVTLRKPLAGWTMQGNQQYVDASGTAFKRNYFKSPSVQIVDKSGIQVEAGQAVASNRFLGFVGRVVGLAEKQGYEVTEVVIPVGTTRTVEARLKDVAYPVKLSVDRLAGEQVEDMARTVRWLQAHDQTPGYVDVRVSGKAFYK